MNTASHIHPCHAPAAVLERKIHDIEFFKRKSHISSKDILSYARKHKLKFNGGRLMRAFTYAQLAPVTELQYMLESLQRGEFAYPTSIVQAFAKKWGLTINPSGLKALLAIQAKERELSTSYPSILEAAGKVNSMLKRAELGGKRAPTEGQIRALATQYSIPLDERRMSDIFG